MHDVMYEVRPLAAYIRGNLRLFMRSGEHQLRIDEEAALRLKAAFETGEPADHVSRGSFVQLELSALDALSWVADSRQPSTESKTDRELRRRGGLLFHGGWLQTMYELAPPGSAYSLAGLIAWKNTALLLLSDYPELDDDSRRHVLSNLCLLWDEVADPADNEPDDLLDRLRAHQTRTAPAETVTKEAARKGEGTSKRSDPEPQQGEPSRPTPDVPEVPFEHEAAPKRTGQADDYTATGDEA